MFAQFDLFFLPGSIDIGAVGFISMRFALFVCSSIHFCEVRFICVLFDLFLCRFDSIFVRFVPFFGPFDLFLRGSIHFLLF